jgi:AcrR family transcriptional regulator
MTSGLPAEEQRLLQCALDAFLAAGFHSLKTDALEAATGLSSDVLNQRYGDRETLFLAAIEAALTTGRMPDLDRYPDLIEMVRRLERANTNPRLRAIHKASLVKLRSLSEEARLG